MFDKINEQNILFLDIETVPQYPSYKDLDERWKKLWDKKARNISSENETNEQTYRKAGIYAEFGKIICISVGYIKKDGNQRHFRIKSFANDDEKKLLLNFNNLIIKSFNKNEHFLCAHNGKEFDFPYIARRILINGLKIPKILNLAGKKPWQIKHLDTLELWRFGDYKNWTSLDLLTAIFNIPTPKDDIDGSMVAEVYYKNNDLERIAKYCEKDVLAVAQLFLKYKNENIISEENIQILT